jgi:phosphate transport system permease protein
MAPSILLLLLIGLAIVWHYLGYSRSVAFARPLGGIRHLPSLPTYYGAYAALLAAIPSLAVMVLWLLCDQIVIRNMLIAALPEHYRELDPRELGLVLNSIGNAAAGAGLTLDDPALMAAADHLNRLQAGSLKLLSVAAIAAGLIGGFFGWRRAGTGFIARISVERIWTVVLLACASIAVLTTLGILLSVLFESLRFFQMVPVTEFLFGTEWSPQIALRADQQGASGSFGAIPLLSGTLLISVIALLVAVPVGLMSAIFLSEYAGSEWRNRIKPVVEVLAGIPTVVYGFFAALTVAPAIRALGEWAGLSVSSESALAAGLVMGIMIIPFVSSLSDDIIHAVPQSMRDGSLALGATRSETIRRVIVPAALPGIVGGILLAASRAIGETMIVVMAAGLSAKLTANPLESVTTVTVQIVTLLVGDQEFDSPKTLAAFALGLLLFVLTLGLNFLALHIVRKYREQYE